MYDQLYASCSKLYFAFGHPQGSKFGDILPGLINVAARMAGGLAADDASCRDGAHDPVPDGSVGLQDHLK